MEPATTRKTKRHWHIWKRASLKTVQFPTGANTKKKISRPRKKKKGGHRHPATRVKPEVGELFASDFGFPCAFVSRLGSPCPSAWIVAHYVGATPRPSISPLPPQLPIPSKISCLAPLPVRESPSPPRLPPPRHICGTHAANHQQQQKMK